MNVSTTKKSKQMYLYIHITSNILDDDDDYDINWL